MIIGISLHSTPATHGASGPSTRPPVATSDPPPATPTPAASVPSGSTDPGLAPSRTAAVAWVNQQVAVGTLVACDAPTCAALTASGFPAAQVVQVGLSSQTLANATVVVVTPGLRALLNTVNPTLGNHVAPAVLARFGQVTVQMVAPDGAAAYEAALSQDVQSRIQQGEPLINNGHVTLSATAQSELAAGDVDSRVLQLLQALASQEPIDVLGFADSGPGASPGIPYRAVDLAESDPAAGLSGPTYLQSIAAILRAHANFPIYNKVGQTMLADGQKAVQIEYDAPSPLGQLAP